MPKITSRARYFPFPHNEMLFDARLEAIREEPSEPRNSGGTATRQHIDRDIVLDVSAFAPLSAPEPHDVDGQLHERLSGEYRPLRLRFAQAEWIEHTGPYARLDALPADEHVRRLFSVVHGREPKLGEYYWISTGAAKGVCILRARDYHLEEREGERRRATVIRRWSPPPPPATGLVPHRPVLYRRFAGDPIAIYLDGRCFRQRLFIGGLHHQHAERPSVDHVLNLCGVENQWVAHGGHHPEDRFLHKGEMSAGMSVNELLEEAVWVVERLRQGRRVLIHCYAGINRSSTVCCAALMLLEGITADAALARIRERHPSAWPDPYHWFVLRQLSMRIGGATPAKAYATPAVAATALRVPVQVGYNPTAD